MIKRVYQQPTGQRAFVTLRSVPTTPLDPSNQQFVQPMDNTVAIHL